MCAQIARAGRMISFLIGYKSLLARRKAPQGWFPTSFHVVKYVFHDVERLFHVVEQLFHDVEYSFKLYKIDLYPRRDRFLSHEAMCYFPSDLNILVMQRFFCSILGWT